MPPIFTDDSKALKAVRRFCLACQGGLSLSVRSCQDCACALYPWRLPQEQKNGDTAAPATPEALRVTRGIRQQCIVCAGDKNEARRCTAGEDCALWPYRFGVRPETYQRVLARLRRPKELWLPGCNPKRL